MTQTVHDLPLRMCKSSQQEHVLVVVALVMDEVVSDADDPQQKE